MYVSTLRRIAHRRWPLVVAALVVTLLGLSAVSTMVPPEYRTSSSVVLVPPKSLEEPDSNRYLSLSSLDQAVGVLVRILTSDEVRTEVSSEAPSGDYEVVADWATSAPIIVVTSSAESPSDSEAVLTAALAQIPAQLEGLQSSIGVTDGQQITSLSLTRNEAPSRVLKPLVRALLGTGVLLLALSLALISVVDGLLLRRARRRPPEADSPSVAGSDDIETPSVDEVTVEPQPEREPERDPEPQPAPVTAAGSGERDEAATSPGRPSSPAKPRQRNRPVTPTPARVPGRKPKPAAVRVGWTAEGVDSTEDRTRAVG